MSATALLDRLVLTNTDLGAGIGAKRVLRLAPSGPVQPYDLPLLYATVFRRGRSARRSAGSSEVTYAATITLVLSFFENGLNDTADLGSELLETAEAMLDVIPAYYEAHARLATDTLPDYPLSADVVVGDTQIARINTAGGTALGVETQLELTEAVFGLKHVR